MATEVKEPIKSSRKHLRATAMGGPAPKGMTFANQKRLQVLSYLVADFMVSYGVWLIFVVLRREWVEGRDTALELQQFVNAFVIASYWLVVYAIAGLYNNPFRRSRVQELIQVFKYSLIGVLLIFFSIILDDQVHDYTTYRFTLTSFLSLQFLGIAIFRLIITTRTQIKIRRKKLGFPTLIVGSGPEAFNIYQDLESMRRPLGYQFKGFVSLPENEENLFLGKLKHFGTIEDLYTVILNRKIEEVIIALEKNNGDRIGDVIEVCEQTHTNIKVVPGVYDYIVGTVKVSHILGAPLIEVFPQIMKPWEVVMKRAFDVAFSLFALILLAPVYLIVATMIKFDSEGPIFYRQERIGKGGRPFFINKFRSMKVDAEKLGPALSSEHDPRITGIGRYLRKLRIDELPQFWNVLIGDMSIVGPRPEREHYIQQIVKVAPHYRHLHKVKPGITSWGQVKYGYAENVDEMVRRLKFDILYLENMSLSLDMRIILYTVIVMLEGRGK